MVDSYIYSKESILIPRKGSLNNIFYANKPFWVVYTMFYTILNITQVVPKYLYYKLKITDFEILNVGSAVPSLTINTLNEILIPLPPLPIQNQIAEILSSFDDKIDLLHRQNQTLESLALTLFRHSFIENPNRNEWKIGKLGDYVHISSGKSLKREFFKQMGKYEILGANGTIGKTDKYLYNERLIYTGRVGTLGKIFMIDCPKKIWLSDNTLIIKLKEQYFYFIYFLLQELKLENYNIGSTQPLIRQSDLLEIKIMQLDSILMFEFEQKAKGFFDKIHNNSKQIQSLEQMRDLVLAKIFSGKMEE